MRGRALVLVRGWPATVLIGLAASAPVLRATAQALADGWQPVADRAIIATRAYDVLSGHMPLVGQYSFASELTGHPTYSLGPMLYWLLAPAAHLGAPGSLIVTMALVNAGSIVLAVALARRRGGVWLMLVTAAAIAAMTRSLTTADLYDIWNPAAALLPLLGLAFVCWSLACGEHRLAPLAALLASYCAQCEDAFAILAAGLVVVAVAGLALSRWRRFATAARVGRAWPWMAAAAAMLLVCWAPVLADQAAESGNLGRVLGAAGTVRDRVGWGIGVRAAVHTVGVPPWWLSPVASPWSRKFEVHRPLALGSWLSAAAVLGWLTVALGLGWRRRRLDIAAGAACALSLCASIAALTAATPLGRILGGTLGYTLWTASIAGMFAWLVAGFAAVVLLAPALRTRRRQAARVLAPALAAATLALAVAVVYGTSGQQRDEHLFEFGAVAKLNVGLGAVPRGAVVDLQARLDGILTPLRPELTYALRRRGVRALGIGAYLRLGRWYELGERPHGYVLVLYDRGPPALRGGVVLATARLRARGRARTVGLLLAPAARKRRRSARRASTAPALPAASSRPGRA